MDKDEHMEAVLRYQCIGRDARVSACRVIQALWDGLYSEGLTPWRKHRTGSRCEGIPKDVCNDLDIMYIHKDYPIVMHHQPNILRATGYLLPITNHRNPAYLTLKTLTDMEYSPDIESSIVKGYLSSSMFVTSVFQDKAYIQETHGPAGVRLINPTKPEGGKMDSVMCLSCPTWPPCAKSFLSRPRIHGWPCQSLMDKMKDSGCHVVPVGHHNSADRHMEWRWSFSVAERELIHNINDKMYLVMYFLKLLKNKYFTIELNDDSDCSTPFCSYFIKTACFWMSEEIDLSTVSVIELCRETINWLIKCYKRQMMPHYFIPAQNLIGHLDEDVQDRVSSWLENVKYNLYSVLLICIHDTDLRDFFYYPCPDDRIKAKDSYFEAHDVTITRDKIQTLLPRGCLFVQRDRWIMTEYSNLDNNFNMYLALEREIQNEQPFSKLLSITENVLFPILNNLKSIVKDGCKDLFTTGLYRLLGGIYCSLYVKYKDTDENKDLIHKCYLQTVRYYTLGQELIFLDGWSDMGLGGFVHLAMFYHLNAETEKLDKTLQKLLPILNQLSSQECFKYVGAIVIDKTVPLSFLPWEQDKDLYTNVIHPCADQDVHMNRVVLAYYLLAKWLVSEYTKTEDTLQAKCRIQRYLSYIESGLTEVNQLQSAKNVFQLLKQLSY